jgi:geranylgeranyl diphosphate synthase type II
VTFAEYLETQRTEVDAALDAFLPTAAQCPAVVAEAMRYSVMAGGKRLRPLLVLAAAEAVAARLAVDQAQARALALPAACAIEMIHTYSLIHDDLPAMDDDELRRGRPTLHMVYGEGMAILAGDGLHAEAFGLLAREPRSADAALSARRLRVLAVVADAAGSAGMVGGQAIDLDAVGTKTRRPSKPLDVNGLREMHARKTGALIRASVAAGALMAGAEDRLLAALDRFASEIGLAFQIVDDILDIEGAAVTLGKTAGKDAAAGKPTYPAFFGLDQSRRLASECLTRALSALDEATLAGSRLDDIARWIVDRRN